MTSSLPAPPTAPAGLASSVCRLVSWPGRGRRRGGASPSQRPLAGARRAVGGHALPHRKDLPPSLGDLGRTIARAARAARSLEACRFERGDVEGWGLAGG